MSRSSYFTAVSWGQSTEASATVSTSFFLSSRFISSDGISLLRAGFFLGHPVYCLFLYFHLLLAGFLVFPYVKVFRNYNCFSYKYNAMFLIYKLKNTILIYLFHIFQDFSACSSNIFKPFNTVAPTFDP